MPRAVTLVGIGLCLAVTLGTFAEGQKSLDALRRPPSSAPTTPEPDVVAEGTEGTWKRCREEIQSPDSAPSAQELQRLARLKTYLKGATERKDAYESQALVLRQKAAKAPKLLSSLQDLEKVIEKAKRLIEHVKSDIQEYEQIVYGVQCVCYDGLDCFKTRSECEEDPARARDELPEAPGNLATTFMLYNKENKDIAVEMRTTYEKETFETNGFKKDKPLMILVQGAWGPNFYGLLEHIKEAFYAKELEGKFNIFMVNWMSLHEVGSVDEEKIHRMYLRPAQNARLVGRQLGIFLKYIHDKFGVSYDDMHLVGYNLGAHVAGYAGKYIRDVEKDKVARITALGPSAPYFERDNGTSLPAACRLDKGDAKFVDAIHTDIPSEEKVTLGMKSRVGHVDFYPNDGKDPQPGCNHMFCSHGRPMEYYEQSFKDKCTFPSKMCSWSESQDCPDGDCPNMGYFVDTKASGVYCVDTTDKEPFCKKGTGNGKGGNNGKDGGNGNGKGGNNVNF
ncbi:pancreatic lipase-related protein 2-like isoform X2 [Amphiura filiformis]|uniref:pancreatic lipase-related protein 2-like isoform X2 n=1 Tax=Amphiura filiformis TaxID=82378 RepID=UPI003B21B8AC